MLPDTHVAGRFSEAHTRPRPQAGFGGEAKCQKPAHQSHISLQNTQLSQQNVALRRAWEVQSQLYRTPVSATERLSVANPPPSPRPLPLDHGRCPPRECLSQTDVDGGTNRPVQPLNGREVVFVSS